MCQVANVSHRRRYAMNKDYGSSLFVLWEKSGTASPKMVVSIKPDERGTSSRKWLQGDCEYTYLQDGT